MLDIDTKKEWHRRPHRQRLGGDRTRFTTRDKYRMPSKLVEYLAGFEDTHYTETCDSEPHSSSSESSSGSSVLCSQVRIQCYAGQGILKKKKLRASAAQRKK